MAWPWPADSTNNNNNFDETTTLVAQSLTSEAANMARTGIFALCVLDKLELWEGGGAGGLYQQTHRGEMSWELNPVFFSPNGPVVSSPSPNLSQEEDATWTAICRSFPHSLAIAPAVEGVAKQSVLAAIRHRELEPFVEKYPDWPLALALQAEVHYLLNDTYGSCVMMERLKHIIEPAVDNAIDNAVKNLRGLLERPD
ncbi:hypothetical protein BC832DRAFT_542352, partial [Gaertneriomyces semiglobifer]